MPRPIHDVLGEITNVYNSIFAKLAKIRFPEFAEMFGIDSSLKIVQTIAFILVN